MGGKETNWCVPKPLSVGHCGRGSRSACFSVPLSCVAPEAEVFQRKLDETTRLLRELQEAQNERLSTRPPPNTICLLGPSYREMHLGRRPLWGRDAGSDLLQRVTKWRQWTLQP